MTAAARWRADLEAWKLPDDLLSSVPVSPYAWSGGPAARLWAGLPDDPVTGPLVRSLTPAGGSVLDVGAGYGRLAVPLAVDGYRVVAVEPNQAMAAALVERASAAGAVIPILDGRWPAAGEGRGLFDVVLSANVVYDVWDLVAFLIGGDRHARLGVVVELTASHPWDGLRRYYRVLHGIDLPSGPTVDDFVEVVGEAVGMAPHRQDWETPPAPRFADHTELFDFYRVRLCLGSGRLPELVALVGPEIIDTGNGLVVGDEPRHMATVWWEKSPISE